MATEPDPADEVQVAKSSWQIATEWYDEESIVRSVQEGDRSLAEGTARIPLDVSSEAFGKWLTREYRLAMNKGIELARAEQASKIARLEGERDKLERALLLLESAIQGSLGGILYGYHNDVPMWCDHTAETLAIEATQRIHAAEQQLAAAIKELAETKGKHEAFKRAAGGAYDSLTEEAASLLKRAEEAEHLLRSIKIFREPS